MTSMRINEDLCELQYEVSCRVGNEAPRRERKFSARFAKQSRSPSARGGMHQRGTQSKQMSF